MDFDFYENRGDTIAVQQVSPMPVSYSSELNSDIY